MKTSSQMPRVRKRAFVRNGWAKIFLAGLILLARQCTAPRKITIKPANTKSRPRTF